MSEEVKEKVLDNRSRFVSLADGTTMKRVDFIRQRWAAKVSRKEIARELSELVGATVKYQVVFASTKNVAGGPDEAEAVSDAA